jgi:hypothetical protein
MKQRNNVIRKALAAWLPALLIVLSVTVPMIDLGDFAHEVAVESEHNSATCPTPHDHTICTQVGANLAIVSAATWIDHSHAIVRAPTPVQAPPSVHSVFLDGHPSRAPPLT